MREGDEGGDEGRGWGLKEGDEEYGGEMRRE